jgi:hypothetical protein
MTRIATESVDSMTKRFAKRLSLALDIQKEREALESNIATLTPKMISDAVANIQKLSTEQAENTEYLCSVVRQFLVSSETEGHSEVMNEVLNVMSKHVEKLTDVLNAAKKDAKQKREDDARAKVEAKARELLAKLAKENSNVEVAK